VLLTQNHNDTVSTTANWLAYKAQSSF
jgi:hypothetical protein